jgi:BirA family biotin operon repressor/biotin-[acetyl-CoA-carboxylase] ligase
VGTASALDASGALVVRDDDGVDHLVTVGDVVHLRPA